MADALVTAHAFRILTVGDEVVRGLAWDSLRRTVARRIGRNPSNHDLATYRSGSLEGEFSRDGGGHFYDVVERSERGETKQPHARPEVAVVRGAKGAGGGDPESDWTTDGGKRKRDKQ